MDAPRSPLPLRTSGRLLVAVPALADPNFAHAVVLVLEHDDEGAAGLVLNQPSQTGAREVLPMWAGLAPEPPQVFIGGPVRPEGLVGVARSLAESPHTRELAPGLAVVDLDAPPGEVSAAVASIRLFAGYAGWGPGQLDAEVAAGSWFVVDAAIDDVHTAEPAKLWRRVLVRQGGLLTTAVEDPSRN